MASQLSNRNDRIDLQPDNATSRVYNIDPKTGLPLSAQYEIRDQDGNLVYTDADGNVLFNGLTTFGDLKVENVEGARIFSKTATQYNLEYLLRTLDFSISELTGGVINTINFLPGGSDNTDVDDIVFHPHDGTVFGGSGGGTNGPGSTSDQIGDYTSINDLIDLINSLRDKIDDLEIQLRDCDALKQAIDDLKAELDEVISDNEDLLDLVEALQDCKERLERVVTAKNDEIIRLADELARASVENANLEQRITELEKTNVALIRQNTELATRPAIQVVEVPGTQTINVTLEGGGSTGGGSNDGGSGGGGTGLDGDGNPLVGTGRFSDAFRNAAVSSYQLWVRWSTFIGRVDTFGIWDTQLTWWQTSPSDWLSLYKIRAGALVSSLRSEADLITTERLLPLAGGPENDPVYTTYLEYQRQFREKAAELEAQINAA